MPCAFTNKGVVNAEKIDMLALAMQSSKVRPLIYSHYFLFSYLVIVFYKLSKNIKIKNVNLVKKLYTYLYSILSISNISRAFFELNAKNDV